MPLIAGPLPCPWPAAKNRSLALAHRDARRRDGGFDLVAEPSAAGQTPEMKPHARPRDRVEIGHGWHYVLSSGCVIFATLGTCLDFHGIAAFKDKRVAFQ